MFNIEIPTFIFTILSFLVLFWLLKRFLFKPVTHYMENRSRLIRESLEEAEKRQKDALQLKEEYEQRLKSASSEAESIINSAREKARNERREIILSARKEVEAMKEEAGRNLERERAKLIESIRGQVSDLILMAAEKVVEENMDDERNRHIVSNLVKSHDL